MGPLKQIIALLFVAGTMMISATNSHAQWVQSSKSQGIAYFLFSSSPRIERYALTNGQWLSPVNLPSVYGLPSKFCVDEGNIYVAYGQTVKRYTLTGGNEFQLINTAEAVQDLFTDGSLLLVNRSSGLYARYTTLNKTTGNVIAQFEGYINSTYGASIAPSINKIFGRSSGISPSDITYVQYNDDGTFVRGGDSPHHGDYPGASRTWVFPDETKVVDNSGTVYSTSTLNYLNSFGGSFTDIDFYGTDIPIVLRGSNIVAYSNSLLPTGSRTLSYVPNNIFVAGTNVLTFTWDTAQANGIRVNAVPLSDLNPPTPGQPVNPAGLNFTPDFSFVDTNVVLYLFSKTHQSLFRWDTANQRYLTTIPLAEVPSFAAYSPSTHRAYIAYPSGLIRQLNLGSTNLSETPFANLATAPRGLATAGKYVFAMDASGAWGTHYTFDPSGTKISSRDWNYYSTEFIWSEPNQKMYFFRDDTSPNDLLWEQINANGTAYTNLAAGAIGSYMDSPLHDSAGFIHPIRVAPDGSIVVLGSGVMHNAATLGRLSITLANSIADIAWAAGELKTIRSVSGLAQFQAWDTPNYGQGIVRQVPGTAHRLLSLNTNSLLALTLQSGRPTFYVMDKNFNIIAPPVLDPPTNVVGRLVSTSQVNVIWEDVTGEESYSIERKTGPNGTWGQIATASTSSTNYADGSVLLGNIYYYRVIARNGNKASAPSAEVAVNLVLPNTPTNIAALTLSSTSIRVSWNDVENETAYLLERRLGTAGTWSQIAVLLENATAFTNVSLSPDTDYHYRIRATNGIGSSDYSQIVNAFTDAIPPTTPTLNSATATSSYSVSLAWSNVSYEDNYLIERRTGTNGTWNLLVTVARDVVSYTDNTVQPATLYEYRLYATNRAGASVFSNTRSVTTPQLPPPSAPTGLSAKILSASAVSLTWTDVVGETGYRVQRRTESTNSWVTVSVLNSNLTASVVSNLVEGVQYFFRVQAFNDVGDSAFSSEVTATPYNIVLLIEDDFDPDIDLTVWSTIGGGVATNGGTGFRGNKALWFGSSGTRQATTIPIDTSRGATLEFLIRAGNEDVDGNTFWNNSETGETVVLEYSKDNGISWTTLQTLNTVYPALTNWTLFSIPLPSAALSSQTQFRWRQPAHSGLGFDSWALDNLAVVGATPVKPATPAFIISSTSSSTSIAIFWTQSAGATAYILERKLGSNNWTPVATTSMSQTYFTDTSLRPSSAYTYRVKAANAGGESGYSPITTSVTWSQKQQWIYDNYGDVYAISESEMEQPGSDGVIPLLRFAFNMDAFEPVSCLAPGQSTSGTPAIWLDPTSRRLTVEFIRRKSSLNPGISYEVQFSDNLTNWSSGATLKTVTAIDATWERVRYEDAKPQSNIRFSRVVVMP